MKRLAGIGARRAAGGFGRGCIDPALQAVRRGAVLPAERGRLSALHSSLTAPGGKRTRDNLGGPLEHLIGVERRRVNHFGVGGCRERCDPTQAVARVAFLHVLQDIAVYRRGAALPQLPHPPFGPRLGAGGDEQLHGRVGAYDRADISAVEYRAIGHRARAASAGGRRVGREIALEREQRRADLRDRGDDRGGAGDVLGEQPLVGEEGGIDAPRRGERRLGIGRVGAGLEHEKSGRAIELAGIEMRQPEAFGQAARQRALARGGRPVDRNDKRTGRRSVSPAMAFSLRLDAIPRHRSISGRERQFDQLIGA